MIEKLDGFIRKYYRNRVIRGILLSFALLGVGALVLAMIEHVGRLGVIARTTLFYSFLSACFALLSTQIVWPLLQWLRISKGLTYDEAAKIVGEHFPEVKDKLLNTLQLQRQVEGAQGADVTLLAASIDQRTASLRPLAFGNAVDVSASVRALKYALPVATVIGVLLWTQPEWVTQPISRLVNHNVEFVEPAPFRFQLITETLRVPSGEPLTLEVELIGDEFPKTVYLVTPEGQFRMEQTRPNAFQYTIPALRVATPFQFRANGWSSQEYRATPYSLPSLADLQINATPPRYTQLPQINQRNQGDLVVPEGTPIQWTVQILDGSGLRMTIGEDELATRSSVSGMHHADWVATDNAVYWVVPLGEGLVGDSLRHRIRVIKDGKPAIRVVEAADSTSRKIRYFNGSVQDDYGFSRLSFVWSFVERGATATSSELSLSNSRGREELTVPTGRQGPFFHTWDMTGLDWREGDVVECWFELWDNDGVHGAKMVRSRTTRIAAPTQMEIREERDLASASIEENLSEAAREAAELREAMEAMQERLREQGEMTWQDRQAMEDLLEQQQALQDKLESMREQNERKDERSNEFSEQEQRLLEKQEQLQNIMDNIMNEELRQIYEQMEELLQEMDPEMIQDQLNEMELNHDAMEKELDRALEQFRQLEWETKMDEVINDLKKLSEEQQKLSEETESEMSSPEYLKAKQDRLNQAFEGLRRTLDQLEKDNQELKNPNPMMDSSQEEQSIQENMKQGSEQLEKGKEKKASESQQKAAEQMEQLAQQMEAMQMESQSESASEDMDALRALLENILTLSFEEEGLMAELKRTGDQDPRYVVHGQAQRKLKDDATMVEDSLFALSMRVPQLASAVNREIGLVNHHMTKALDGFGDRLTEDIAMNQQYVMTSFNNLALLLDDALQQMQQQEAQKQPGSGNCEKPGGTGSPSSSPKSGDMKKMQDALGKKLEQMKEQMGKGANQGKVGQQQPGGMSKELAQMAAQQAALRKMAQEKARQLNEDGSGNGKEMSEIAKEMEEIERDLVNKQVDEATLKRQQDLITRLLEAENAERIRGEKEERTSRTGDENLKATPPQASEYLRKKMNELELMRTVPAELLPYYRDRVNEYFNTLDLDSGSPQPDLNP